jgi:hypothetical protein
MEEAEADSLLVAKAQKDGIRDALWMKDQSSQ